MLGHKILHCILREKFLELTVQLCSKGLIVRYYQSRLIQLLDDIRHSKCLTGTRNSKV